MKKLFVLIALFSFFNINVYAKDLERTKDNNYGVNKHWKINNTNLDNVLRTPYVDASKKIYDYADILTDEEEQILYSLVINFIERYDTDLVFLTDVINYYDTSENEEYAVDFYDYNDFGLEFDNYSGIVLFRNANANDPYYDIYTFGDAQLYFDQERYDIILDGIYSDFRNHRYLTGYKKLINKLNYYYEEGKAYGHDYYVNEDGYLSKKYSLPLFNGIFFAGVAALIIILVLIAKNKLVRKAYDANGYLDSQSIKYSDKQDIFVKSYTRTYTVSSSSGSGGRSGGGGSSRGSSGGGHSSGGGRRG